MDRRFVGMGGDSTRGNEYADRKGSVTSEKEVFTPPLVSAAGRNALSGSGVGLAFGGDRRGVVGGVGAGLREI